MAHISEEKGEILKNEEVLQRKYKEIDKITNKHMVEINEIKGKVWGSGTLHSTPEIKQKYIKSSDLKSFKKTTDNGDTNEDYKTGSSNGIIIQSYILQKEIDRLIKENVNKDDTNNHLQEKNNKLTVEKDKYLYQVSLLKEKIRKHDEEIEILKGTLKNRDSDVDKLLKDIASIEKKYKHGQILHEKQKLIFENTVTENKLLKETAKKLKITQKENEAKHLKTLSKNDDILTKFNREIYMLKEGYEKQSDLIQLLESTTLEPSIDKNNLKTN